MDSVAQGSPIHIMTLEAEVVKAESGVSWGTDTRKGHRHLQNGLEVRGKLVDRSGPTGSKRAGGRSLPEWGVHGGPGQSSSCRQYSPALWYMGFGVRQACVPVLAGLHHVPCVTFSMLPGLSEP